MARLRGMMASSLDGFAAEAGGGVGFLDDFDGVDWGYDAFIAGIGTVVMGRRTYEHMLDLAPDWPYPGKRGIVVSRSLTGPLRGDAEVWSGELPDLVAKLRDRADGDVWIVGGPMLQSALIAMGALDRLELCIVPCILGTGIRTFPPSAAGPRQPELTAVKEYRKGLVILDYRFGTEGGRGR